MKVTSLDNFKQALLLIFNHLSQFIPFLFFFVSNAALPVCNKREVFTYVRPANKIMKRMHPQCFVFNSSEKQIKVETKLIFGFCVGFNHFFFFLFS